MLLLSYLDKIGLSLTAEAGQTLAFLYSEARLYKGPRLAGLFQSATTRSTGNISVRTKKVDHSNTRGTVSSLFFGGKLSKAEVSGTLPFFLLCAAMSRSLPSLGLLTYLLSLALGVALGFALPCILTNCALQCLGRYLAWAG